MKQWIVDGLEPTEYGIIARVEIEEGKTVDIPLICLPEGTKEGSVLSISLESYEMHSPNGEYNSQKGDHQL